MRSAGLRTAAIAALALAAALTWAAQPFAWQHDLAYDGGGYWTVRVPVTVDNPMGQALKGAPVTVTLSHDNGTARLIGQPVASLRAVLGNGHEVVFALQSATGADKREGDLAAGDVVTVPVEAPANGAGVFYLYAGDAKAWLPPDWMRGGLSNGGFEAGSDTPDGWTANGVDAEHKMSRVRDAHSGKWCAECEVAAGAEPTWVSYSQGPIPVVVGQTYRFTAWVKAQGVVGTAGWYVHVDGAKPLIVNKIVGTPGTFGWKQITCEFTVPEGGQTFTCGTVLRGTGKAWYDDARLVEVGGVAAVKATVGAPETMQIAHLGGSSSWPGSGGFQFRAPIVVRNFRDTAMPAAVVPIDARPLANALGKIYGFTQPLYARIDDPAAGGTPPQLFGSFDHGFQAVVSMPARTEKTVWLYFSRQQSASTAKAQMTLPASINLCRNGDMEEGTDGKPAVWQFSQQNTPTSHPEWAHRVQGGVSGKWCLEVKVPAGAAADWAGWTQRVAVKPDTSYMLSGYLKCQDLDGATPIYGHFLKADGSLCTDWSTGTSPSVSGTQGWTYTSEVFTTPSDCAFLEIHLTTNDHGTLWQDAVSLAQVAGGPGNVVVGAVQPRDPLTSVALWSMDKAIKPFASDLPPMRATRTLSLAAARDQYEAGQFLVRSPKATTVRVWGGALSGPASSNLTAPAIYHVDRVPIDFPVGYDSTTEPSYYRHKPHNRGNDGWTGWWPDPLAPADNRTLHLAANTTEAFYVDYHIPYGLRPGSYTGAVHVDVDGKTVDMPVHLTVWDFTMPEPRHLPAFYDYGPSPGATTANIRMWQAFLTRYNISGDHVFPEPTFSYANGKVSIDFTKFDAMAHYMFDELHVTKVYTPSFFYACGWAYPAKDLFGFKPGTPEYDSVFRQAYSQFIAHITAKGWRNRFVFYVADEPHDSSKVTITDIDRLCDMAKKIAPDVPSYSSTWHYIPGLSGHLTQWGIGPQGTFPPEEIAKRRAAGDRFWFTTDGQMCTDTPFLAIERILPWLCFKYDIGAYEFWGCKWHTYDPWKYGWHAYISQSDNGVNYYYVRYPNGDGFNTYPGKDIGQIEPAASIRLVAAREGVDDYEVFLALHKFEEKGNVQAHKALDRIRNLVQIPNGGGRYSTGLMHDPEVFAAARRAAGDLLSRLESR